MIIQLLMIACNPCIVEILLIIKLMVEPILANVLYHLVDHKSTILFSGLPSSICVVSCAYIMTEPLLGTLLAFKSSLPYGPRIITT